MKQLIATALLALATLSTSVFSEEPPPTGEEIQRLVRMSNALQNYKLEGQLRDTGGKKESFTLNMEQNILRFRFSNPNMIVHLDQNLTPASLNIIEAGNAGAVPLEKYGESVRGFAMNYEDLSMRFLYWPGAKMTGEESIKTVKCWKVRMSTPDRRTSYGTVDLWVHQGSGGMARMQAYDFQGKMVKKFEVVKIQKIDGKTILKEMKVEQYDPASGKRTGQTYMTLDNPEKN